MLAGDDTRQLPITNRAYLELVEWTGRRQRADKRGFIEGLSPSCLARLPCNIPDWLKLTSGLEMRFGAAVGSSESLRRFAADTGRRWIRGVSAAW